VSEVQIPLGGTAPPETAPRPFLEVTDLWLQVHRMSEVFFAREAGRASAANTIVSILILSVVSAILSLAASALQGPVDTSWLPPEYSEYSQTLATDNLGCTLCTSFFGTLLFFYAANTLTYVGARLLGGRGDFTTQAYLESLYRVPIGIVSSLLALVPIVGGLLKLVLWVLQLVYDVRAVKAAHDTTTGRAVAAVLAPVAAILVLVCVAVAILGASIMELIGNLSTGI